ncbi:ABC transporter permease [Mucilaginibacter pocheonensis]|uniref:ABC transport system permease protein n=1 Tax=Mucilaginibacter pocheonensis TaxID=398050 RepID=A0ABU1TEC1_9SPHI|nr:ABC transporter permease [Mucilaginibacter pocheonensis]MDR6943215.1 putative ABC transport system permease protein [Mucilaginibacter pocheonensis]
MLKNYIKIAWRNLYKNKAFSLIHILGLTMGITVCLMIFLYITNEFSFDKFHKQGKNIYRVMRGFDATKARVPYLSGPYAPALLNDYPKEIKAAVRVQTRNDLVSFGEKAFNEKKVYATDAGFFSLFSFPLIKGDAATVLKEPGSIVLNETTAKRYFGSVDNAMGKVVQMDKRLQLKVTGVARDVPANSHMDFDMVMPIANYVHDDGFNVWVNNSMFVYVLLDSQVSKAQLENRFPQFMDKYMGKDMARFGAKFDLKLTPLTDIYFEPSSAFDNVKHGEKNVVFIFISIAILIMLIACINFMNLSTIRAVERSKEVGMRKVMGALRNHLIIQFIGESFLLTLISCALSIGLLLMLMPWYNQFLGYELAISWNKPPIYLFLMGVILVVGFLAGSYPAFFLSAFSPIQALKGKLKLGKSGTLLRQSLVVLQFSISVLLIIGTIVIMNQMSFVKSKSLGYDKEQTVLVSIDNNDIYNRRRTFKDELQNSGKVTSVSLMSGEPGGFFDVQVFDVEGQHEPFKSRSEFADFEYVKTLGLKVIAGRDFSAQYATDTTEAMLINRTAAKLLGFTPQQAIGKWIKNTLRDDKRRRVIGVVEDFNFLSLKENMDALVISPSEDRRVAVIKLKPGNIKGALATIKDIYSQVAPIYPFEYKFLDQQFDTTYRTDIKQQTMLSIFSGLAIFIACLGLFGLASFTAAKRTKEIGVRKVLGSSVQNILLLISKDLLKPVLLATVIAMPVGYYCMHKWLQSFAYRTSLHWWIFVLAAVVTFIIALLTISIKSVKAALANPVNSLRSE